MATTSDPAVGTDGKGISSPPADEERRTTKPADGADGKSTSDTADEDLTTTGKGIS